MKKLTSIIILAALLLLGRGGLFLMTWDIPVPAVDVERTIPNDRFSR